METFVLEDIDHERVDMVYDQLNVAIEEFQELYNWYQEYAELSIEAEAEAKYLKEVEGTHSAAVKLYVTYKKALKLSVKKAKVKLLEINLTNLKESVRAKIDTATEVVESVDDNMKKTAKTVKNKLRLRLKSMTPKQKNFWSSKSNVWTKKERMKVLLISPKKEVQS